MSGLIYSFPAASSRVPLASSCTSINSLSLPPSFLGDIVTVVAKEDDVWWCGQSKGKMGMFPSAYVEPYDGQVDFVWGC